MFPTKPIQPIPLSTRIHVSKLDTHLSMHQDIHDVVKLTLWPAHCNRRSGGTLGLFLPIIGWSGWKSPLHEFEAMHRNNCGCIKPSKPPLAPLLLSKKRIYDRKNILFVIIFGVILGINLVPPLLCSIVFGIILDIWLARPLFCSAILIWPSVAFPLCWQGRLRLGQGGHWMSLRHCNKRTERQGVGGCGIRHGGYCATTPSLLSSRPWRNMQNASRALSKVGKMARGNATTKATTMMSNTAAAAAMSCTQCRGVG